jgi:hypothetical protein
MAINLPYPDIDFVPLDILTAAELNMLVANEEYLANMWATSDTNGIIEARHLKYQGTLSLVKTGAQTLPGGAYVQVTYDTVRFSNTALLQKNGSAIKNVSGETLVIEASVTLLFSASRPTFAFRCRKVSAEGEVALYTDSDNTRGATCCGVVALASGDGLVVESYQGGTLSDVRNLFSASILGII